MAKTERTYFTIPAKVEDGVTVIPQLSVSELILEEWHADYYIAARKQRWNFKRPMYVGEAQRFFNPPTLRELQWANFGLDTQGLPIVPEYQDELIELSQDLEMDRMLGEWTSSWVIDGKHLLERPRVTIHYAKKFLYLVSHLLEPPHCRIVNGNAQGYILDFAGNIPTKISGDPQASRDAGAYLFNSAIYSLVLQFGRVEELEVPFAEFENGKVVAYTKQGFPAQTAAPRSGLFILGNAFSGNAHLIREGLTSTAVLHHSPMDPLSSFNIHSFLPYSGGEGMGVRRIRRE